MTDPPDLQAQAVHGLLNLPDPGVYAVTHNGPGYLTVEGPDGSWTISSNAAAELGRIRAPISWSHVDDSLLARTLLAMSRTAGWEARESFNADASSFVIPLDFTSELHTEWSHVSHADVGVGRTPKLVMIQVLPLSPTDKPVEASDLTQVREVGRDEVERTAPLIRLVEPLYHELRRALDDDKFTEDRAFGLEQDVDALRRELYETDRVRVPLLAAYVAIGMEALAELEAEPQAAELVSAVLPDDGKPLGPVEVTRGRDKIAESLPFDHIPNGVDPKLYVDQALGWRDVLSYGDVGTTVSIASVVGGIVAAVHSPLAGVCLGAWLGVTAIGFVAERRVQATNSRSQWPEPAVTKLRQKRLS